MTLPSVFKGLMGGLAILALTACDWMVKAVDPIAIEISSQVENEPWGTQADLSLIIQPGQSLSVIRELMARLGYEEVEAAPAAPGREPASPTGDVRIITFRRYRGLTACRTGFYVKFEIDENDEISRATGEMHEEGCL